MVKRWTAALVMLVMAGAAAAQNSGNAIRAELAEKLDLFQLCPVEAHMDLFVAELPGQAGLTTGAVIDAVESRLRTARVYDANAGPLLQVTVVLANPEEGHVPYYSIEVAFLHELIAERLALAALAETWSTHGSGQGDAGSFLAHLGSLVDEFVAEHARVGESEACRALRRAGSRPADGRPGS